MYAPARGGSRRSVNIWPGFVDGLASLLLVVIFVLMVFMVAQYFLTTALTSKDEALLKLNRELQVLADTLAMERSQVDSLKDQLQKSSDLYYATLAANESLTQELSALRDERDSLSAALAQVESVLRQTESSLSESDQARTAAAAEIERLAALIAQRDAELAKTASELEEAYKLVEADKEKIETHLTELAILKSLRDELTAQLNAMEAAVAERERQLAERDKEKTDLQAQLARSTEEGRNLASQLAKSEDEKGVLALRLQESEEQVAAKTSLSEEAQRQVDLLNRQILSLRQQLAKISEALEISEAKTREQDVQIADLGRKLNLALATKVQELARYRSEFFGRLREVLGNHQGIRVVGDRFVFQSEVLFASGSAELGEEGRGQMAQLAKTLREIAGRFPEEIDWILRVDGHTDKRPISTAEFPSNWELSTQRAISVVKFLIAHGIPAQRLAATGFGQFQPIDEGEDEIAYRRNRRIELKLDQR